MEKIKHITDTMQLLKLDGRKFEILTTECGTSIVPSIFAYSTDSSIYNNEVIILRKKLPGITIHSI